MEGQKRTQRESEEGGERADIVPPANRPERDGASSDEFQAATAEQGKVEIAPESDGLSPFRNTRVAERQGGDV